MEMVAISSPWLIFLSVSISISCARVWGSGFRASYLYVFIVALLVLAASSGTFCHGIEALECAGSGSPWLKWAELFCNMCVLVH